MKLVLAIGLPILASLILAGPAAPGHLCAKKLFKFQSRRDFAGFRLVGAKWNGACSGLTFEPGTARAEPDGLPFGLVESPNIETGSPFDEVVVSWNAETPPGSYLKVYIQARSGAFWSRRFAAAIWNRDNRPVGRMSVNGQEDDIAKMDTDILKLNRRADAFRVAAKLCSSDGRTYPTLRLLTVHVLDSNAPLPRRRRRKSVWGKDLPVPERSQLSVPDGHRFCSPAATAMVLDYWAEKLDRPELSVELEGAVEGIYDKQWGGTGNWTFNTAYAGEFGGLRAYVTRFSSVAQIEEWIANDVPVIVSLDYDILRRKGTDRRSGHLVVMRGFTPEGDCILNDPNFHPERGQSARKVFKISDLKASWLSEKGSLGTVYLIYPNDWPIPKNRDWNW